MMTTRLLFLFPTFSMEALEGMTPLMIIFDDFSFFCSIMALRCLTVRFLVLSPFRLLFVLKDMLEAFIYFLSPLASSIVPLTKIS